MTDRERLTLTVYLTGPHEYGLLANGQHVGSVRRLPGGSLRWHATGCRDRVPVTVLARTRRAAVECLARHLTK
jgi:hypothetical protein